MKDCKRIKIFKYNKTLLKCVRKQESRKHGTLVPTFWAKKEQNVKINNSFT